MAQPVLWQLDLRAVGVYPWLTHPNAVGLLLVNEIVRYANAAKRLNIIPWRNFVNGQAMTLMLGVRWFFRAHHNYPESAQQVVDDGILSSLPFEPVTGLALEFLRDRHLILGPSLNEICPVIPSLPSDAPPLEWQIPGEGERGHSRMASK